MESCYRNFYRNFYLKTGGFIPSGSLNQNILPGDFFQIRNGEMIILGNIFQKGVIEIEDEEIVYGVKLNPSYWNFSDGVSKPYSGRGSGKGPIEGEFEFSKQVLAFEKKGSFYFKAHHPESVKIGNWNEIQQQLIIKMTQTMYSFRELYIVVESAVASDWTLVISGSDKGELEIATDSENFGLVDIFGHHSAKTIQSKEIEYYHREPNKRPVFLKAKKLVVQNEQIEVFVSDLITEMQDKDEWARGFYEYDFYYDSAYLPHVAGKANACLLDMLQANQLNPSTALRYFKWEDANLDDIEKLFKPYGN